MREVVQMQKIKELLAAYDGKQPLSMHLRQYYRLHKEMGSRDRKIYTQLAYGYFRQKGAATGQDGYLISAAGHEQLLHAFYTHWLAEIPATASPQWNAYFPFAEKVTDAIDTEAYYTALHQQPAVWIRCKQDHIKDVLNELEEKQYRFSRDGVCIRLPENYPLQEMRTFEEGYFEIQDIASQSVVQLMHPQKNASWWDCCAGSGGKSLLLLEAEKQIQLFVSDSRESILHNLQERFRKAGVRQYAAIVADLEQADDKSLLSIPDMQGIIADVPCSGSGTWARTPERMHYFSEAELNMHIERQRTILSKVVNKLLPGGSLLYITCSVYAAENEQQVNWLCTEHGLQCVEQKYFSFATVGGDTLFGALLQK